MKLPVSLLSTYLYCPRKVFLQRVLKLREPLRQPLIFGTIRHETLEKASLAEQGIVCSIIQESVFGDVYSLYMNRYAHALRETVDAHAESLRSLRIEPSDAYEYTLPSLLREAESRAVNTYTFFERTGLLAEELWEALTPKISSEVRIESEKLQLVGVIDQLHDYGPHVVPVELKTGKMPREGVWPGHRVQAAAYALMLQEHSGREVREAVVHYLDGNEKRQIIINPFMREEIVFLVKEIQELLANTLLPEYCDSRQKCAACGLRTQCYDAGLMQSLLASSRATTQQRLLVGQ
jgi:CRISPR-associated protein Cas4